MANSYLDWIDDNGNIKINLYEISSSIHQEFEITARRRKLRRLEHISAFTVAKYISCQTDAEELLLQKTMKHICYLFLMFL